MCESLFRASFGAAWCSTASARLQGTDSPRAGGHRSADTTAFQRSPPTPFKGCAGFGHLDPLRPNRGLARGLPSKAPTYSYERLASKAVDPISEFPKLGVLCCRSLQYESFNLGSIFGAIFFWKLLKIPRFKPHIPFPHRWAYTQSRST